ncbi:hypothetical protein MHYP_G00095940 [Metynnis hypsauchen]
MTVWARSVPPVCWFSSTLCFSTKLGLSVVFFLPELLCFACFTMRLYGMLLIIALVLAGNAAGSESQGFCDALDCFTDINEHDDIIFEDGNMTENSEKSSLPASLHDFSWSTISCFIYKSSLLNCSWSTHMLPADAQYSAFFHFCNSKSHDSPFDLNCSSNHEMERVECLGRISSSVSVTVQVNISIPNQWYITCKTFSEEDIEILDPPEITSATIKSKDLEINWLQPKSINSIESHCFEYELKINDETVSIGDKSHKNLTYTKKNIDLARSYSIQIRTRMFVCVTDGHWSDWSESKVVSPIENPYQLNVYVIASIAFVLPMILLAFLLVCKFQRLSEKLFPSIPSPSVKVKTLLDKEDFGLVLPPKLCGSEAEEGTEICQVTS